METTPVGAAATQSLANTTVSNSVLTSDFEVFLQMLTTQARYQDPLEPIDSSEYASQLAQFSMVEQQVQTNTFMEELLFALSVSETVNLANWIGLDALQQGPGYYNGDPVMILPSPPADAEEMYLVVRDGSGNAVQTEQFPVSNDAIYWDGMLSNGQPAAVGEYVFEIESRGQGEIISVEPAMTYRRVEESRIENGEMRFILEGGLSIGTYDVLGLRTPS